MLPPLSDSRLRQAFAGVHPSLLGVFGAANRSTFVYMSRAHGSALARMAFSGAAEAQDLRRNLLAPLQSLLGAGPVFVASADPTTWLFTGGDSTDIPSEAVPRFLHNEYAVDDVVKFRAIASAPQPYEALSWATGGDLSASARWREVLEPLGWADELRIALREGPRTWGFLCLHRPRGDGHFDREEVGTLTPLLSEMAGAFRRLAPTGLARLKHDPGPGVVLVDAGLSHVATTGLGRELLASLESRPDGGLPIAVRAVAAQTLAGVAAPSLRIVAQDGRWLKLSGGLLDTSGSARVAVVIEPAGPADRLASLAAAARLTPRETQIATAVLRGRSTGGISAELHIAQHTVQDHLKAIYVKCGVHSRRELTAAVVAATWP